MARWQKTRLSQADQFSRKREAVLQGAGRAFALKGYHNTTLDDVARALDISKAALYTYIKTKQEILFECHRTAMDLGDAALKEALSVDGTAAEKLEFFVTRYVGLVTDDNSFFAILTEIDALTPEDRVAIVARRDAFERRFARLLKSGVTDGSLIEADAKVVVFAFMGAFHWLARWFKHDGRLSSVEIAGMLSDVLMRGVDDRKRSGQRGRA